jgi:membrane protein involved in colicin uptake
VSFAPTPTPTIATPSAKQRAAARAIAAARARAAAKAATAARAEAVAHRKSVAAARARAAARAKAAAAARAAAKSSQAQAPVQQPCTQTSSGSCIRGGEFCKQALYGQTGYDAEGRSYVCKGDSVHPHWEL